METRHKTIFGLVAAFWMACTAPVAASDPAKEPATEPVKQEPSTLSAKPVNYRSEEGSFQVIFPGGCGKLVTRANEPDLFAGEELDDIVQVTHVYCDRYQTDGEGCSVTATFNLHDEDGEPAGPQQVIDRIERALEYFGAEIISQQAVGKDYGDGFVAEGVEARAKSPEGNGEIWIRGLLILGDIYIFLAWNEQGGVWNNPEYITFFNSFQPWTD